MPLMPGTQMTISAYGRTEQADAASIVTERYGICVFAFGPSRRDLVAPILNDQRIVPNADNVAYYVPNHICAGRSPAVWL